MLYREFGKTGKKLSVLGFGCMRFPEIGTGGEARVNDELAIPLLRRAYELGVNYFDTAWNYNNNDSQRVVGAALKPFRDKVFISTKLPLWNVKKSEDFWTYLLGALERLDTTYIDFYHFHGLNAKNLELCRELKLFEKMRKARELGLIRHISFSFHDKPEVMREIVDTGVFSSLLCQYNLIDRSNEEAMAYAVSKGVGVVVMGPLGGGNLVRKNADFLSKLDIQGVSPHELCLAHVLNNPSVTCAISGMTDIGELEANVAAVDKISGVSKGTLSEVTEKCAEVKALADLYCTACRYCEPECPKKIKPASALGAYNMMKVWGLAGSALSYLKSAHMIEWYGTHPSECIKCGACIEKCPQKIDVPNELQRVMAEMTAMAEKES